MILQNPNNPERIVQYKEITAALRVEKPDGTKEEFAFWFDKKQLQECHILRFFCRIRANCVGRYMFTLRVQAVLQDGIAFGCQKTYTSFVNYWKMSLKKDMHHIE